MAKRIAVTNLNARTIDILNVIRQNASFAYQSSIPQITTEHDIPTVGETLYGYPALANEFINALVNRIALVKVKSATFNNAYANLKKGYLEFGEVVEEVFVNIAKAREFSVEKAAAREFKRTVPDVRSAFHAMNWQVQYPITIQQSDLKRAFTSASGVADLIDRIIAQVYTAAEYDEYLLFKYLLIKGITKGKLHPISFDGTDIKKAAVEFRAASNQLTFIGTEFNAAGVHTNTDKKSQYIFMDSKFNASYDVEVLAAAFNMDKADFMGNLKLIDSWTTFDNERFAEIRANSDMIEEVTAAELSLMAGVKAVLVDEEWFQIYDNLTNFTEAQVASGMYWNYFLNVWKTVASSPFSNAIVFVDSTVTTISDPASITAKVTAKDVSGNTTVITLAATDSTSLNPQNVNFVQTQQMVTAGVAMHPYGAMLVPSTANSTAFVLEATIGDVKYKAASSATLTPSSAAVGNTITLSKVTG